MQKANSIMPPAVVADRRIASAPKEIEFDTFVVVDDSAFSESEGHVLLSKNFRLTEKSLQKPMLYPTINGFYYSFHLVFVLKKNAKLWYQRASQQDYTFSQWNRFPSDRYNCHLLLVKTKQNSSLISWKDDDPIVFDISASDTENANSNSFVFFPPLCPEDQSVESIAEYFQKISLPDGRPTSPDKALKVAFLSGKTYATKRSSDKFPFLTKEKQLEMFQNLIATGKVRGQQLPYYPYCALFLTGSKNFLEKVVESSIRISKQTKQDLIHTFIHNAETFFRFFLITHYSMDQWFLLLDSNEFYPSIIRDMKNLFDDYDTIFKDFFSEPKP